MKASSAEEKYLSCAANASEPRAVNELEIIPYNRRSEHNNAPSSDRCRGFMIHPISKKIVYVNNSFYDLYSRVLAQLE
jgi:hypothetical protein